MKDTTEISPTRDELTFSIWGTFAGGIWGTEILFAERTMRDVREALEHGRGFKTDVAERALRKALAEATRIQELLDEREGAR